MYEDDFLLVLFALHMANRITKIKGLTGKGFTNK